MKNPIFCALDSPDAAGALSLAKQIAPYVGGLKMGLEFFCAAGPEGIRRIVDAVGLPLFLDLKFHDIPNTVAGAIRSVMALRPALLTIHAHGGHAMMAAAAQAAAEEADRLNCPRPKIVGVTVLTSLDAEDLRSVGVQGAPTDQVSRLAQLAHQSGLDGLVCSPQEVAIARQLWPQSVRVVPGIRPAGADTGDQKRIMGPKEALAAGATILVIGRPITSAPHPGNAAETIARSLPEA